MSGTIDIHSCVVLFIRILEHLYDSHEFMQAAVRDVHETPTAVVLRAPVMTFL